MMKYVKVLAPCGLNCAKCLAYVEGDIKKNAGELKEIAGELLTITLRGFPVLSRFLKIILRSRNCWTILSRPVVRAAATETACTRIAVSASCYKTKGVDFCFQCDEFPCEKTNFDPNLKERWIKMNRLMKEKGVEAYYEESKDLPRYV